MDYISCNRKRESCHADSTGTNNTSAVRSKMEKRCLLDDQKTPLHIICESPGDHHELLDLMINLSQQTIIDQQDSHRHTAMMYAVKNSNINCLKSLIIKGADVTLGIEF